MGTNGKKELTVRRPFFPELTDVPGDLRDMFREMWDMRWPFTLPSRALRTLERQPALDVFEREGKVVVKAEMPGIDPARIDVSIVGDELRISGEREEEKEVKDEDFYRSERSYGRIFRALTLPEGCDTDQVAATMKDGVLEVVLARKQAVVGKKVEVTSA
jgi:HSP20 family protein